MNRTILIVSGGIEALPCILRAKEMGLHVLVSDADPHAPGFASADDRLIVSTYDVERTTLAAMRYHETVRPIHGVMCAAADVPVTVAAVAGTLRLPGIPMEAARLAANKLAMKEKFTADGVPVPWFSGVGSAAELGRLAGAHGFPLVLKPVDSRGARGVLRLDRGVDLEWAYRVARSHSPQGRVMVERFLDGPQVSTESMIIDGRAHTPGFSDRNYEYLERYAPCVIENGGELPSCLDATVQGAIRDLVERTVRSMGIRNGVAKGDIVVHRGEPYVIELAARLSGGYFCSHEIPLSTGVDFVGQAIRLALGDRPEPADLHPRFERHVAQRYLFPRPGRVVSISGAEEAAARPGIELCEIRIGVGDVVERATSHPTRAGVVIATGESRAMAIDRAVNAVETISVETEALS